MLVVYAVGICFLVMFLLRLGSLMFKSKLRKNVDNCFFDIDWIPDGTLDNEFNKLIGNADFYVLKHWFLNSSCAPSLETFEEKQDLKEYIEKSVMAGDGLEIWSVQVPLSTYFYAKMPNEKGCVPIKGAY